MSTAVRLFGCDIYSRTTCTLSKTPTCMQCTHLCPEQGVVRFQPAAAYSSWSTVFQRSQSSAFSPEKTAGVSGPDLLNGKLSMSQHTQYALVETDYENCKNQQIKQTKTYPFQLENSEIGKLHRCHWYVVHSTFFWQCAPSLLSQSWVGGFPWFIVLSRPL